MEEKSLDPGLGEKYLGNASRMINQDGSFNIHRTGIGFHYKDLYHFLINLSWPKFMLLTLTMYVLANLFFATLYFLLGTENLIGSHDGTMHKTYWDGLFFSVQTLTTVGYGGIVPRGLTTNILAALEAMTGLLGFAIITGLLYGRFSKPTARILYSKNAIISTYQDKYALMFRIANQRNTNLMEIEARVILAYVDLNSKDLVRKYRELKLERNSVNFLSLNWTLVHPVDELSPLFNKTNEELKVMHAEILILIKGFDETFSQNVHSRYSYRYDEIIWGAKFKKAYTTNDEGKIVFNIHNIHDFDYEIRN